MSTATLELVRLCEALPEAKQTEVTDFARFLLEREADERWEAIGAGGSVYSCDHDFGRFPRIDWTNPLD